MPAAADSASYYARWRAVASAEQKRKSRQLNFSSKLRCPSAMFNNRRMQLRMQKIIRLFCAFGPKIRSKKEPRIFGETQPVFRENSVDF